MHTLLSNITLTECIQITAHNKTKSSFTGAGYFELFALRLKTRGSKGGNREDFQQLSFTHTKKSPFRRMRVVCSMSHRFLKSVVLPTANSLFQVSPILVVSCLVNSKWSVPCLTDSCSQLSCQQQVVCSMSHRFL